MKRFEPRCQKRNSESLARIEALEPFLKYSFNVAVCEGYGELAGQRLNEGLKGAYLPLIKSKRNHAGYDQTTLPDYDDDA